MPEGSDAGSGIKGFLGKDTAGLPNWGWLLIIAGGIAAAYFLPKFLGGQGTNATDQGATNAGTAQSGTNGIGLAIDPTTGLPYAVEGLSPSGGLAGSGGAGGIDLSATNTLLQQILANLTKTTPPPTPTPKPKKKPGDVDNTRPLPPKGIRPIPPQPGHTATVTAWPHPSQGLSDVARMHGVSEQRLRQLNPQIAEPHNLQPGQKVRVA